MPTIATRYEFCSAHSLPHVPDTHKCKRVHGHNYTVEIIINGQLRPDGMILDFFELDDLMAPLVKQVDHFYLNDIPGLDNPTAENIAAWFRDKLVKAQTFAGMSLTVRVYETPDCYAEVSS